MDRSKPENHVQAGSRVLWSARKQLGQIIERCIQDARHRHHSGGAWTESRHRALNILLAAAITVAVCDAVIPPQKKELMEEADQNDRKDYQAVPQRFDFQ